MVHHELKSILLENNFFFLSVLQRFLEDQTSLLMALTWVAVRGILDSP